MFLSTGTGSILEGCKFLRKEVFRQNFVTKIKKTLLIMSQKLLYIGYAIVYRKNRKLRPNLLLTL